MWVRFIRHFGKYAPGSRIQVSIKAARSLIKKGIAIRDTLCLPLQDYHC